MSFEAFYEKRKNEGPRKNITWFLNKHTEPGIAVDLGCGVGNDTIALIKSGWTVYAFDAENTESQILEELTEEEKKRFIFRQGLIQDVEIPKCDLVVANLSLQYLKKEEFKEVIDKIYKSLNSGGYFLSVMLTNKDPWAKEKKDYAFFGSEELNKILKGRFKSEQFLFPEPYKQPTATGEEKEWHTVILEAKCINKNLINTKRKRDEEER